METNTTQPAEIPAVASSGGLGINLGELYKLAAEMARGVGMPSPFLEDWNLPKTTPLRARVQIMAASDKADVQCKEWAVRIRRIIDAAGKSPNSESSPTAVNNQGTKNEAKT